MNCPKQLSATRRPNYLLACGLRLWAVALLAVCGPALVIGLQDRCACKGTIVPIELEADNVSRARFKAVARYELALGVRFTRHMGIPDADLRDVVFRHPELLSIWWAVRRGGKLVAGGNSRHIAKSVVSSDAYREAIIGHFRVPANGRYQLEATIEDAPEGLAAANPALVVRAMAKEALLRGTFFTWVGVAGVTLGFCLLALAPYAKAKW